ncbi:uncharacterized protein K452DRAFT_293294 [Aplosporella prunicola CBS 121167]|uniref:Uncharacterized protein n=1 Tax=Aplosporella prunicola CBS 121167 TaxID=1176127 RepID=A0A6A6AXQ2_9PEZI|nr:uncharacterized protein K452DRAFT_293294 [Aplosporella prunicola CBS 121167]KAF2135341.1 hypothetical protein K452DRAFT_293294 [Aplosporella prunicola CBS 121167]
MTDNRRQVWLEGQASTAATSTCTHNPSTNPRPAPHSRAGKLEGRARRDQGQEREAAENQPRPAQLASESQATAKPCEAQPSLKAGDGRRRADRGC